MTGQILAASASAKSSCFSPNWASAKVLVGGPEISTVRAERLSPSAQSVPEAEWELGNGASAGKTEAVEDAHASATLLGCTLCWMQVLRRL